MPGPFEKSGDPILRCQETRRIQRDNTDSLLFGLGANLLLQADVGRLGQIDGSDPFLPECRKKIPLTGAGSKRDAFNSKGSRLQRLLISLKGSQMKDELFLVETDAALRIGEEKRVLDEVDGPAFGKPRMIPKELIGIDYCGLASDAGSFACLPGRDRGILLSGPAYKTL